MTTHEKPTGSLSFSLILLLILMFGSAQVWAQDEADDQDQTDSAQVDDEDVEELAPVVTTGSRLLRQTYDSISPMQVITAEESREVGKINAGDIIQGATASGGQQIDLTFAGFVLDNGPGSVTANLRGLGADRTLVLVNGRRLGGSGVEGAPSSADLNTIPGGLVQQYDILLDGASSIYGSDAVAGVVNAVLRKDFNGWEVNFDTTVPEQSNGIQNSLSLTWGKNYDRGFIGFGAELNDYEEIKFKDREWTNKCYQHYEVTESGEVRQQDIYNIDFNLRDQGSCFSNATVGRLQFPLAGFGYYTGDSNGGWPGFTIAGNPFGGPMDTNGDGVADLPSYIPYSLYDHQTGASLSAEVKIQNVMAYGEYTFEGDSNITPFFEASYNRRDTFQDSGQPQFFPWVPANNPYNLCNPDGLNGVDCGLAWDELMNNPGFSDLIFNNFGCDPSAGGSCDQTVGPLGPQRTRPVIAINGDRDNTSSTVELTRFIAGVRGDMPFMNFGSLDNWNFETSISYHESDGTSSRRGIREDHLMYSLNTSRIDPATGEVVCGNNDGCVPINLFSPSLYSPIVSDFGTAAERAYLFDSRDFRTKVEQTIFSGFTSGYLADLPAGPLVGGIGFEIRKDEIRSIPDDVARDGLFFGFFADGGATGSKFTREAFAEFEIPLLANMTMAEELTLNISGRYTKDEFFPSANTYSAKLGWRPVSQLLIRATKGTSYRAPNLRENFLQGQTGFQNVFDPCHIPDEAWDAINGVYLPNQDPRRPEVLENCSRQGVDPTALYNNGFNTFSTEIQRGGATDITEEESDSFTYGFAWDVPFDSFNLTVGATYYEIEINNTIVEPSPQFIVNDCYTNPQFDSTFCNRITRDADGVFDIIDSGFLNRDNRTARGIDVNVSYDQTFNMFDRGVDFGVDLRLNHTKENSELFTNEDGDIAFDDDAGEYGNPDWRGTLNLRADIGKY